jgi:tetrahydromethanopterin S-methyltransferase subunit C
MFLCCIGCVLVQGTMIFHESTEMHVGLLLSQLGVYFGNLHPLPYLGKIFIE